MLRFSTALAFVVLATCGFGASAPKPRPNIVLIMADDFGFECITANGGQSYQTPNVDQLAATGVRFEQCHVQPLCTPTRVQLMTGIYNVRNYIEFGAMDKKATTFGHLLKNAGYATGVCGKWQLGTEKDSAQKFGFDESFLWHHMRRTSRYANPGFERNGTPEDYMSGGYGPTVVNDFALDFITRHKDQPFFLYYPMLLTHSPFQPTPESPDWNPKGGERGNVDVKHFAEMTRYMDKMVGRVIAKLDTLGLRENTLVLFLGDNGTGVDITSRFKGQAYPGGKGRPTARGTHVPGVANWSGRISPGQVSNDIIGSVDFMPTICEAAGVPLPASYPGDGRSFLPQLLGQRGQPRDWLYFWYAPDGGVTAKHEFAMSTQYKLYREGTFFDLTKDPFEEHPLKVGKLTGEQAAAAKKLQAALDQYAHARPPHLLQPIVTAKQQKKAGKGKKQRSDDR